MYATGAENPERIKLKIVILALAVFFLTACFASFSSVKSPVKLTLFPEVPQEGEPIIVTFSMKNYDLTNSPYTYTLYANGEEVMSGNTMISPLSTKKYQYAYVNDLEVGEKVSFVVKVESEGKSYEEVVTAPPYHPYVWSSFVSFAAFSTTMTTTTTMSITSMAYYDSSFGVKKAINVGLIFSVVLIALLIHVEITEPFHNNVLNILGRLRRRFTKVSAILFIIFITMIFSQIVIIIG
ncbi:MAG: hypothetical protein ACYS1A_18525 [Planctomycetota bacterium]|jgi:hypothetical protein